MNSLKNFLGQVLTVVKSFFQNIWIYLVIVFGAIFLIEKEKADKLQKEVDLNNLDKNLDDAKRSVDEKTLDQNIDDFTEQYKRDSSDDPSKPGSS